MISNDAKFNLTSVHMLANFLYNFYPDVLIRCKSDLFIFPLKRFIRDMERGHHRYNDDPEYSTWQQNLVQAKNAPNSCPTGPQVPSQLSSDWVDLDYPETDLSSLFGVH